MKPLTIDTSAATLGKESTRNSASARKEISTPRRSATMGFSSKDLIAADLARDQSRPLHVPPMLSTRPGASTLSDITVYARKLAPGILRDEENNYFAMSKVLASGTFGNIRLGLKYDAVVSQVWIFKEVASQSPTRTNSFADLTATPKRVSALSLPELTQKLNLQTATPAISAGPEESLESEVNLMHKAHSPLAPHGVLRTADRAYLMLPLADTDLHKVWTSMYQWPAEKRQPIVLAVARQFMSELSALHQSGAAHRDLKPSNIFLTREGATFLGDYGMAMPFDQSDLNVGTLHYLAPEVLYSPEHDKQKSDIFSAGAVLTSLLINTGFFWKELWDRSDLVAELRGPGPSKKSLNFFVALNQNYRAAFETPQRAGADKILQKHPIARAMYKQLAETRRAFPNLFMTLRSMQHPDPAKRPSAKAVVIALNSGVHAPTESDGAELRRLLATSERPMRAAADAQALELEATVRNFMQSRNPTRRNSLDSVRRYSTAF